MAMRACSQTTGARSAAPSPSIAASRRAASATPCCRLHVRRRRRRRRGRRPVRAGVRARPRPHDLGEHRLKDLGKPERIFQLGHADDAPLTTLAHTNLPTVATPLLGRQRELDEATDLLGLGVVAGRGAAVGGIALVAAADGLVEDAGGRRGAFEARMRNEALGAARHALGPARFDDAYAAGRALSPAEAVRQAAEA